MSDVARVLLAEPTCWSSTSPPEGLAEATAEATAGPSAPDPLPAPTTPWWRVVPGEPAAAG